MQQNHHSKWTRNIKINALVIAISSAADDKKHYSSCQTGGRRTWSSGSITSLTTTLTTTQPIKRQSKQKARQWAVRNISASNKIKPVLFSLENPFGSYPTRHISPIGSCSPPNTFYPDFARDFQKYQSDSVRT